MSQCVLLQLDIFSRLLEKQNTIFLVLEQNYVR